MRYIFFNKWNVFWIETQLQIRKKDREASFDFFFSKAQRFVWVSKKNIPFFLNVAQTRVYEEKDLKKNQKKFTNLDDEVEGITG